MKYPQSNQRTHFFAPFAVALLAFAAISGTAFAASREQANAELITDNSVASALGDSGFISAALLPAYARAAEATANVSQLADVTGTALVAPVLPGTPEKSEATLSADSAPRLALPTQEPKIKIHWGGPVKSSQMGDGQCTEWAALKRGGIGWFGNANQWAGNARKAGYKTGDTPIFGAILVTPESGYGHVAFVEEVDYANRTFTVSEQNFVGWGIVSRRKLSFDAPQIVTFIY